MSDESKILIDEFLKLKRYDIVDVTLDWTPDGVNNPETKRGMFFKFAENLPVGYIPFGYVRMEDRDGWFPYYAVKKVDVSQDPIIQTNKECLGMATEYKELIGQLRSQLVIIDAKIAAAIVKYR